MDRERESLRQTQRPMQIKQVKTIKRSLPINAAAFKRETERRRNTFLWQLNVRKEKEKEVDLEERDKR